MRSLSAQGRQRLGQMRAVRSVPANGLHPRVPVATGIAELFLRRRIVAIAAD